MQKAFNKTIIKLQNTSRVAEEQVSKNLDLEVIVYKEVLVIVTLLYLTNQTFRLSSSGHAVVNSKYLHVYIVLFSGPNTKFVSLYTNNYPLGPASDGVHSVAAGPAGEHDSAGSQPVCQSEPAAE